MNKFIYLLAVVLFWVGCSTPEESISFDPRLEVVFSNDSVAFDTLLTESRSSTRRLTVFNPNQEAIQFSTIYVGLGEASDYSVIINGKAQQSVSNEVLLGGDSLMILVEVNIDPRNNDLPYLVKDSVVFEWNTNRAHVKLISYGQDGNRIRNQVLCDEIWTSNRPYIISDTLVVGPNCTLSIQEGTRVYFENDAVLFVQGTMSAVGDSANHVVFTNARFDGIYDEVPGQWNGIYFLEGSVNNEVHFADISNAQIGLRIGTPDDDADPDVRVSNTTIFNMSLAGILAFTSDVEATNTLIYNCGTYLVGNFAGGNYTYSHCTFSNEPSLFIQDQPTVQFSDNIVVGNNEVITADLNIQMVNSIVWGSSDEELTVNNGGGAGLAVNLVSNIIRTGQELENNYTSQSFNFPGFKDAFLYDYSLDTLAFAKDKGVDAGVLMDLPGAKRDALPDIGAYERIEK